MRILRINRSVKIRRSKSRSFRCCGCRISFCRCLGSSSACTFLCGFRTFLGGFCTLLGRACVAFLRGRTAFTATLLAFCTLRTAFRLSLCGLCSLSAGGLGTCRALYYGNAAFRTCSLCFRCHRREMLILYTVSAGNILTAETNHLRNGNQLISSGR